MYQATLKRGISISGIGVHGGSNSKISILPAEEGYGIVLKRSDLKINHTVVANYKNVSDTRMCTRISDSDGKINFATVEHMLAALYGVGISNAIIEVNGDEVPILDGSAMPFVQEILSVGIETQSKKCKTLKILKVIKIEDGQRWSSLTPSESFTINIECDYKKNGLETNPFFFDFSYDGFIKEIGPARTFGFFSDAEFLRKNNLAKGASLENTVVFDENGAPMNENGLRFPNEPLRHKVLDIIGDFSLSCCRILGNFNSFCPSHKMNNQLLRSLFANSDNFEIVE